MLSSLHSKHKPHCEWRMCYAQMRHLHLSLSPEHTHSFWVPELILGPWAAPRGGGAPPKDMENRSDVQLRWVRGQARTALGKWRCSQVKVAAAVPTSVPAQPGGRGKMKMTCIPDSRSSLPPRVSSRQSLPRRRRRRRGCSSSSRWANTRCVRSWRAHVCSWRAHVCSAAPRATRSAP